MKIVYFFKIRKLEIICFNTGICFLLIKTNLDNTDEFTDILNFNYRFRDIQKKMKELEHIKIYIYKQILFQMLKNSQI